MNLLILAAAAAVTAAPTPPKEYHVTIPADQMNTILAVLTKTTVPLPWEQLTPVVMNLANQKQQQDTPPPPPPAKKP